MILILEDNYDEVVNQVLRDTEVEYLALTVFYRTPISQAMDFLKKLKRIFKKEAIVLLSDIEYLANDLDLDYVLHLKDFRNFNLENFMQVYANSIPHTKDLREFLSSVADFFDFDLDISDLENPWYFLYQNHGVLVINDKNYMNILQNYHKIKAHTTDLAFINLNEEGVEQNLKLLKMLGSDAQLTFGLTNHLKSKFSQWIDLIIHQRSPYYEKNIQEFIFSFFSNGTWETSLKKLQDFFEVEEKSFEADLYEEEIVIKTPKRYFMRIEGKETLPAPKESLLLFPKNHLEYYCLEKDENFV